MTKIGQNCRFGNVRWWMILIGCSSTLTAQPVHRDAPLRYKSHRFLLRSIARRTSFSQSLSLSLFVLLQPKAVSLSLLYIWAKDHLFGSTHTHRQWYLYWAKIRLSINVEELDDYSYIFKNPFEGWSMGGSKRTHVPSCTRRPGQALVSRSHLVTFGSQFCCTSSHTPVAFMYAFVSFF